MKKLKTLNCIILFLVSALPLAVTGQYKVPSQEVIDIIDAKQPPHGILSPSGELLILAEEQTMPSIAYLSQPLLRIGGIRIIPSNNSAQRTSFFSEIRINNLTGGPEQARSWFAKCTAVGRDDYWEHKLARLWLEQQDREEPATDDQGRPAEVEP